PSTVPRIPPILPSFPTRRSSDLSDFSIPINAPSLCGQKSDGSHHRLPKRLWYPVSSDGCCPDGSLGKDGRPHPGRYPFGVVEKPYFGQNILHASSSPPAAIRRFLHLHKINALKRSRVEALRRIMSKFGITQKEFDGMNEAVMETLSGPMTQRELPCSADI